jgi:hypothetical protein
VIGVPWSFFGLGFGYGLGGLLLEGVRCCGFHVRWFWNRFKIAVIRILLVAKVRKVKRWAIV